MVEKEKSGDKKKLTVIVFLVMTCVILLWAFVFFPKSQERIAKKSPPTLEGAIHEIAKPSEEEIMEEESQENIKQAEEEIKEESLELKDVPRFPLEDGDKEENNQDN